MSLSELSSQKSGSRLNVSLKSTGVPLITNESIPAHMRSDSVHSQLSNYGNAATCNTTSGVSPQKTLHFSIHEYAEPYTMAAAAAAAAAQGLPLTKEQFATIKRNQQRARTSIYGNYRLISISR